MKKNKLLAISLIACSLLTGCDKETYIKNDGPVGNVDGTGTVLQLQKFYENLKDSSGGSVAMQAILTKLFKAEYGWEKGQSTLTFKVSDTNSVTKNYHTLDSFKKDVQEKFQDILDAHSYTDDNGEFDAEKYKDYIDETYDYADVTKGTSKYLDGELAETFKYNYDEYIEGEIVPSILENYIYVDYLTATSKYKAQFANQYAVKLEVLKLPYNSTKLNGTFYDSLVTDVKAVAASKNGNGYKFHTGYGFAAFDKNEDLIIFETTEAGLTYKRYSGDVASKAYDAMLSLNAEKKIVQITVDSAKAAVASATPVETLKIDSTSTTNEAFYKTVEKILIARDLWGIDRECVLAKNYDYKTAKYYAMTESEKSEASGFSSTYSSSNSKPIKDVAKTKKISVMQNKYYTEPDYYNKSSTSNVLPSALSTLRGYSAKELITNLRTFNGKEIDLTGSGDDQFLMPTDTSLTDPVYLDVSSSYYYVCEVSEWYGLYLNKNLTNTSTTGTITVPNFEIEAYQAGEYSVYSYADNKFTKTDETVKFSTNPEKFESIIELVNASASNVLTTTMKKEAIIALFETYELSIHDEDVWDYIEGQYPDYFEDDD